ncbi:MAG: hypothetical protein ABIJ34_02195 [archaeon]
MSYDSIVKPLKKEQLVQAETFFSQRKTSYVQPRGVTPQAAHLNDKSSISLPIAMLEEKRADKNVFVVGDPGAGKTIAGMYATVEAARNTYERQGLSLILYMTLDMVGKILHTENPETFFDYHRPTFSGAELSESQLWEVMGNEKTGVVVDSLDEVVNIKERERIVEWISAAQSIALSRSPNGQNFRAISLAGRPYVTVDHPKYTTYLLEPLTPYEAIILYAQEATRIGVMRGDTDPRGLPIRTGSLIADFVRDVTRVPWNSRLLNPYYCGKLAAWVDTISGESPVRFMDDALARMTGRAFWDLYTGKSRGGEELIYDIFTFKKVANALLSEIALFSQYSQTGRSLTMQDIMGLEFWKHQRDHLVGHGQHTLADGLFQVHERVEMPKEVITQIMDALVRFSPLIAQTHHSLSGEPSFIMAAKPSSETFVAKGIAEKLNLSKICEPGTDFKMILDDLIGDRLLDGYWREVFVQMPYFIERHATYAIVEKYMFERKKDDIGFLAEWYDSAKSKAHTNVTTTIGKALQSAYEQIYGNIEMVSEKEWETGLVQFRESKLLQQITQEVLADHRRNQEKQKPRKSIFQWPKK